MVYVSSSLFNGGSRVVKPSRREFLKYGAIGAAGIYLQACAGNDSSPMPGPTPITGSLSGNGSSTFGGQPLSGYMARAAGKAVPANGSAYMIDDLTAGAYSPEFEGGNILVKRVLQNVSVNGNTSRDFSALTSQIDIDNYRTMCMGINSPYPFGGAAQNHSRSLRLRPGVNPRVIVVRNPGVQQGYYQAIDDARSVFGEITRGILNVGPLERADTEPLNPPEGSIVVVFENRNGFVGGVRSSNNFYIIDSKVHLPLLSIINTPAVTKGIKHEYGHSIGLDHSNYSNSLMAPSGDLNNGIPTQNDIDAGYLKYSRNGGHELNVAEDRD